MYILIPFFLLIIITCIALLGLAFGLGRILEESTYYKEYPHWFSQLMHKVVNSIIFNLIFFVCWFFTALIIIVQTSRAFSNWIIYFTF